MSDLVGPEDLVKSVKEIAPKAAERDLLWAQLVFILTNRVKKFEANNQRGQNIGRIFLR